MNTLMALAASHPVPAAAAAGVAVLALLWGLAGALAGTEAAPVAASEGLVWHPAFTWLLLAIGACVAYGGVHYLVSVELKLGSEPVVAIRTAPVDDWIKADGEAETQRELNAAL